MNAVAMNVGCYIHAIRHLRQPTGPTEDWPHSGLLRITMRGQNHYIQNTHLCNHFQTATATAANTHGIHNSISAKTECYCLHEGGLSACRQYVGCVLARRHHVNCVNWTHTHQNWLRQQWNSVFSLTSRGLWFEAMAGFQYTIWEINIMLTVAYLNEIFLGVGILSWSRWAFALILTSSKGIWMPSATEMKFLRGTSSHYFKIMPLSLFFSMIMPQAIQLVTLWISSGWITLHLLMTGLPNALIWIPLSTFGIIWISVLNVVLSHHQMSFS